MKNYSNLALTFLQIILWISLISSIIAMAVIILLIVATVFDLNLPFLTNMKINISDHSFAFNDLKTTGKISLALFGISALYYFWLFVQLIESALKVLKKVDFKNPFTDETANLISKMGSTALKLGILNIILNSIFEFVLKGNFSIELSLDMFNFFVVAAILYIIGSIFKKGVEIQSENDLTI